MLLNGHIIASSITRAGNPLKHLKGVHVKLFMGKMRLAYGLGGLLVALLGAQAARADDMYAYTGNAFTFAQAPFTISEFDSGSFTLGAPLGPGLSFSDISGQLLNYSFSNGFATFTNNNSSIDIFEISTNSSGTITAWDIGLFNGTPSTTFNEYASEGAPSGYDNGEFQDAAGFSEGQNQNDPGSWTAQTITPEPGSLLLFGTGVLWIVALMRRKIAG